MESFDGAEICELARLYILNKVSERLRKENIGLYRDDGLGVLRVHLIQSILTLPNILNIPSFFSFQIA